MLQRWRWALGATRDTATRLLATSLAVSSARRRLILEGAWKAAAPGIWKRGEERALERPSFVVQSFGYLIDCGGENALRKRIVSNDIINL